MAQHYGRNVSNGVLPDKEYYAEKTCLFQSCVLTDLVYRCAICKFVQYYLASEAIWDKF
jgi:hypothetical protein